MIHKDERAQVADEFGVAIIGMAGRFPGAPDVSTLWSNLANGVESIATFTDDELLEAGVPRQLFERPGYVRRTGVIDGVELFDPATFGLNARDAALLDPQHRVFLECVWEALEHAGYDPARVDDPIGVYAGAGMSTHIRRLGPLVRSGEVTPIQLEMCSEKDFLSTRASHLLDLRGPSIAVQTACSTSLVAIHIAARSVLGGECQMAVAGGVAIAIPQRAGYLHEPGGVLSPDGCCRVFDHRAAGFVPGSGAGVVVLKHLAEAIADRDSIYAVIRGSAINNDGARKVGYAAPSVEGQARAIAEAMAISGIDTDSISYVEAHGTGTLLGDPIEMRALSQVLSGRSEDRSPCWVGSIKSNIGHLDAAAGVAGLIKTVLALVHEELPPTLHFERCNPSLELGGRLVINNVRRPWPRGTTRRRAGVSSFGIGGTNAHIVLEEAPGIEWEAEPRRWEILPLSARTKAAFEHHLTRLGAHLPTTPTRIDDAARTLRVGRRQWSHRGFVVGRDIGEVSARLTAGDVERAESTETNRSIVYLFPDQGAPLMDVARRLYEDEPAFKAACDRCATVVSEAYGSDVRRLLFPTDAERATAEATLRETAGAQPAMFTLEYSLAKVWEDWTGAPAAVLGHSVGEYAAACISGVMTLETAATLVVARGRMMQAQPRGALLAVDLGEEAIAPWLRDGIELAGVNGPRQCILGGTTAAVTALMDTLHAAAVTTCLLQTSHAFHTSSMDAVVPALEAIARREALHPPTQPWISSMTGDWMSDAQAVDPAYWGRQARAPVRLREALAVALGMRGALGVVMGPGRTLANLARSNARDVPVLTPCPSDADAAAETLRALGRQWLLGGPVHWERFRPTSGRRVPLPTYPFERQRFWVEQPPPGPADIRDPVVVVPSQPAAFKARSAIAVPPIDSSPSRPRERPMNEVETWLAHEWSELLGISAPGVDDTFIALGGHSLLALQLLRRIRERYEVDIQPSVVFADPSIGELALRIEGASLEARCGRDLTEPAVTCISAETPLTRLQRWVWWLRTRSGADERKRNVCVRLDVRGEINVDALRTALREVVRRHDALRATFVETAAGIRQRFPSEPALSFEHCDLTRAASQDRDAEIARRAEAMLTMAGDVSTGPPLRACWCLRQPGEATLLLAIEQLVIDGWSIGIVLQELDALYRAPDGALPRAIQFSEVAAVEASASVSDERADAYWLRELMTATPLPLPLRRPEGRRVGRAAWERLELMPLEVDRFDAALRRVGVTRFVGVIATLQLALTSWLGVNDVVVACPIADRSAFTSTVGFMAFPAFIRSLITPSTTVSDLARTARAKLIAAREHQRVAFDTLADAHGLRLDAFREVMVVQELSGRGEGRLGNARLEEAEVPGALPTSDLCLHFIESGPSHLILALEYAPDRFRDERMKTLMASVRRGLDAFADTPDLACEVLMRDGGCVGAAAVDADA
jgi:acyl transferase domain-containing protein